MAGIPVTQPIRVAMVAACPFPHAHGTWDIIHAHHAEGLVIRRGRTGRVVPGSDPAAFAEGILHIMQNQNLAARSGTAAGEQMEKNFSCRSRGQQIPETCGRLVRAS